MKHKSLNQLVCAATINGRFRETLLSDPARAIATGYFGHSFSLTPEEQELVVGIQAQRLEDFAAQIYHWLSDNGCRAKGRNGNGHSGRQQVQDLFSPTEGQVELYRAPALAHA